jgi:hypothetical protein
LSGLAEDAYPTGRAGGPLLLSLFCNCLRDVGTRFFDATVNRAEFAQWLHSKTRGHPYFMAFICRQFADLTRAGDKLNATEHWQEIFHRLEKEKFSADLPQVTDREVQLLRALARCEEQEINRKQFADYARMYFTRLTDKGLLIRTGRGHYRLYHPLFREFLRQTT